ncbi:2-oxoglutarate dehydrogenase E1 component [Bacteroidota bacterium]
MNEQSYLNNLDINAIEELYEQYRKDSNTIDNSWRKFFEGFDFAKINFDKKSPSIFEKEFRVINLIEGYRKRGHLFTETNPVRERRKYSPTLDIENFGLSEKDLDTVFQAGTQIGIGPSPLRDIVNHLNTTYCRSIGAEYMFIRNPDILKWFYTKMEKSKNLPIFSPEEKKHIYFHLKLAVGFENFIHKKFIGQKRFSLEGAESLIPALDAVIEKGANLGIKEYTIGMSHRGRLNVLANILQKPYEDIFSEFIGKSYDDDISLGDVKYHLGYSRNIRTDKGQEVRLNLAPNPSHLEAVDPVVQGIARAKIERKCDGDFQKVCPILIHGDAAIAAQGVVYEVVQMSQLKGYKTGGTIHLVINNQVGFTTNYTDARSSTYCTDIGKVIKAPIFHVNGDDVEALIYAIEMAMEYRQEFQTDVFIDILCYRKYGHNEGDEPRFTQPLLYKAIAKHPNPRDQYSKKLIEQGIYTKEQIKMFEREYGEILEDKLKLAHKQISIPQFLSEEWKNYRHPDEKDFSKDHKTGVAKKKLMELADKINYRPPDKKFFNKLLKIIEERKKQVSENRIDWAMAELLAYASLLDENVPVRISGQDSERGTFSHRHAAFFIEDSDKIYTPLKQISKDQSQFNIYNSSLSEYGVLGFEYGYALAMPNGLTIWEAQFGDFHNVAQVIIDQYISSAEEKWGLMNGLVLFLPHGYEGQGPEHSSARIERFLILAARNNMQIIYPSTPANFFHVLRRQMVRDFRIPLIIFTPKSLLRHPLCISSLDELAKGHFRKVIDDDNVIPEEVKRVILCTGKIYYDLLEQKLKFDAKDIAIIRIEELHPFPKESIHTILKRYPNVLLKLWVQEEPENMGAWRYVKDEIPELRLVPVARIKSGSPAHGLSGLHNRGQEEIIKKVFRKCECERLLTYCSLECVVGKSRASILKQHYYFDSEYKFSI